MTRRSSIFIVNFEHISHLVLSSNEVIRTVLNSSFFYEKILHEQQAQKAYK